IMTRLPLPLTARGAPLRANFMNTVGSFPASSVIWYTRVTLFAPPSSQRNNVRPSRDGNPQDGVLPPNVICLNPSPPNSLFRVSHLTLCVVRCPRLVHT